MAKAPKESGNSDKSALANTKEPKDRPWTAPSDGQATTDNTVVDGTDGGLPILYLDRDQILRGSIPATLDGVS